MSPDKTGHGMPAEIARASTRIQIKVSMRSQIVAAITKGTRTLHPSSIDCTSLTAGSD